MNNPMQTNESDPTPYGGAVLMGVAKAIVGTVRFDVTIRGVDGAEIDAGMLTAPLRAGVKDGKLQVEPADLREAFAEALDAADRSNQSRRWPVEVQRTTSTERRTNHG